MRSAMRRGIPNQERRGHHGHDGRTEEQLVVALAKESQAHTLRGEQDGEFAKLRQGEAADQRRRQHPPHRQDRRHHQRDLERKQDHQQGKEHANLRHHGGNIEQHADGDEEYSAEHGSKGENVRQRLQSVFRFRDDQPGDEGADGDGKPRPGRHHGGTDTEESDAQGKQVAVAEHHDPVQRPADDEPAADHQRGDDREAAQELDAHGRRVSGSQSGEQRQYENERQDAQILKEKDGDHGTPVRRIQFGPVRVDLGDDGSGRQRGQGAVEDRLAGRNADGDGRARHRKQRAAHLQTSSHEYRARPLADMGKGKLESHFEEQEGDADLGQELHLVGGADQSESAGAHQDSGHQETHQGWSRHPVRQSHDGDRDADEQRQVDQQPCFGHGLFSLSPASVAKAGVASADPDRSPESYSWAHSPHVGEMARVRIRCHRQRRAQPWAAGINLGCGRPIRDRGKVLKNSGGMLPEFPIQPLVPGHFRPRQ